MTKHLLNGVEIRSVFKKMRGEGVPQGMGSNILFYLCFLLIVFDDLPTADISLVYIEEYTSIAAKKFINLIKNK